MGTSKAYTVSKLSERPDYYVAGSKLDSASKGYFEEPLTKETVAAFSEVPEPEESDPEVPGLAMRRATKRSTKHYRLAQ